MDYALSMVAPLWQGATVTLKLFFITLALAVPLGLVLALARLSRWPALGLLVNGYIWLMRGTPLMLQMLFIYFALPFVPVIGVRLPDFPAAVLAFARMGISPMMKAMSWRSSSSRFSASAPLVSMSARSIGSPLNRMMPT